MAQDVVGSVDGGPGREPPGHAQREATELVARHARLIRSAIRRVAGARADVIGDDVVQCVTIALWQRLRDGGEITHPASYLYRCVVRETARELARLRDPLRAPLAAELATDAPGPEHDLRGRQLGDRVARCLDQLPGDRARAVRAHLAELALPEIMALHAWPYHKARNLLARGLADLRLRLRA